MIDIDIALNEVLSSISTIEEYHSQCFQSKSSSNIQQEIDAPDLVLNLPISSGFLTPSSSKSLDPIVHSTIIIDLERKKFSPSSIMKKSEKIQRRPISISGSSRATEV
jgi:hypothetical protein